MHGNSIHGDTNVVKGVGVVNLWQKIKDLLDGDDYIEDKHSQVPLQGFANDLKYLKSTLGHALDFVTREFQLGVTGKRVAVLYIKSLADETKIASEIVLPLTSLAALIDDPDVRHKPHEAKQVLSASNITELTDLKQAIDGLLIGHTIVLVDGLRVALDIDSRAKLGRSTTAAEIETTILGSKVAFVEDCEANLSLIRQGVHSPKLCIEKFMFGSTDSKRAFLLYIQDLAAPDMISELQERLQAVQVNELKEINYLQSIIGISPLSPFPQAVYTERPDRVTGNLLEGRLAILLDGSPEALVLPIGFSDLFQSPADYYNHSLVTVLMRGLRFLGFLLATTLPAAYVAAVTYNYELLPTSLVFAVASARSGIPIPPIIEALAMVVVVDILQEGATRLPSKIGQTVGVVGGFVLGQAVIQARLVSPLVVIVVAVSVIGSFATPDYRISGLIRLLRYSLLLASAALSGIGIAAVWFAVLTHMASIEILGIPYLRPVAPLRLSSMSDYIFRKPYRGANPDQSDRLDKEQHL